LLVAVFGPPGPFFAFPLPLVGARRIFLICPFFSPNFSRTTSTSFFSSFRAFSPRTVLLRGPAKKGLFFTFVLSGLLRFFSSVFYVPCFEVQFFKAACNTLWSSVHHPMFMGRQRVSPFLFFFLVRQPFYYSQSLRFFFGPVRFFFSSGIFSSGLRKQLGVQVLLFTHRSSPGIRDWRCFLSNTFFPPVASTLAYCRRYFFSSFFFTGLAAESRFSVSWFLAEVSAPFSRARFPWWRRLGPYRRPFLFVSVVRVARVTHVPQPPSGDCLAYPRFSSVFRCPIVPLSVAPQMRQRIRFPAATFSQLSKPQFDFLHAEGGVSELYYPRSSSPFM